MRFLGSCNAVLMFLASCGYLYVAMALTGEMLSSLREAPNVSVGAGGTSLDVASALHQQAAPVPLTPIHVTHGLHQQTTASSVKPPVHNTPGLGRDPAQAQRS